MGPYRGRTFTPLRGLLTPMGWSTVDAFFSKKSEASAKSIEDAEAVRLDDDDGDDVVEVGCQNPLQKAEGHSGQSSGSEIDGGGSLWWVDLLRQHTSDLPKAKAKETGEEWSVVSACSGLLAEGFVLQANLREQGGVHVWPWAGIGIPTPQ